MMIPAAITPGSSKERADFISRYYNDILNDRVSKSEPIDDPFEAFGIGVDHGG